ncbi:hypothetical protein LTR10_018305 [Elasticomyces elasticus]|uniref:Ubiquitin-like protease family profile domain-containing protein n=1 Tax=Exophiala sideris TaxID=1016849 RepID=A0ABR0JNT1_9EURO|nr:hypothetical protein LTR10_018305 [Elasticomyces elasticus]KAK5036695.1 hypothetical protein LTS07_002423 [Exophiala sideris]KAK5041479.1 hypothetical protein LTR13_002144 [Exophiala sideris]KAK5067079.1 hypothetical protein LTR69_002428 [Exophiala sideris]KAK5185137.1 hypothetical protein LTR44_002984 [Eurotiomycetes sp. CCFEE 6388]
MADYSSFMDWSPATPPRSNDDPYSTNHIPGGWPAEPSTPPSTIDVVARRPAPSGFLPTAKRLCQGIGSAVAFGYTTATSISRYAVYATTSVVTVPTYSIVRRVQQRQRRRRPQPPRRQRGSSPRYTLPESPWNRAVAAADHVAPRQQNPQQRLASPTPAPKVKAAPQPSASHPSTLDVLYSVPDLMPPGMADAIRNRRKIAGARSRVRKPTSPVFPKMPQFTPPRKSQHVHTNTPIKREHTPPEEEHRELKSYIPQLGHFPPTPPSPPASFTSSSPGDQLRDEMDVGNDSDSGASSTFTSYRRPRTISVKKQRSPASKDAKTAPVPQDGPSSQSLNTGAPAIVVQETTAAVNAQGPTIVDTTLLSPPRIKKRRVSTPRSKKATNNPTSPTTPETDFSSTCECSPGNLTPQVEQKSTFLDESDISSFFVGTPPDPAEDARLFKMIMAGGGTPTPENKTVATYEKAPVSQPTTSDTAKNEQSNYDANDIKLIVPESGGETNPDTVTQNEITNTEDVAESDSLIITTQEEGSKTPQAVGTSQAVDSSGTPSEDPTTPKRSPPQAEPEQVDSNVEQQGSMSPRTPELRLAHLTLEDPYTPDVPTPKATPHSTERKQRVTRAEARRIQLLEEVQHYEIAPLADEWEKKIQAALRSGHGDFRATDFTRVVPLIKGRGTDNWLNDEVINGYLKLIVTHGKKEDRATQVPTHHAFVSFFYNNLETRGYESVKRWASRAKIGGKNLLETEAVFIPINSGMHWTLCVVSGKNRTITHYNSLSGNGRRYVETVKKWVKEELGSAYKEEEWNMEFTGPSPQQQNMDDCGVFTITSARQIMLGLTPMSYTANQIQLQRRRIIAELIQGALIKSTTE